MLTEYDVFISYSHLDADWVKDWLLPHLESVGLAVCVDYRDFDIGVPSLTNMENAVERSRKTLLVITSNWIKSEWTNFESLLIQTDDPSGVRQRTLPLMLGKSDLPKRLGIFTYADFTDDKQWDAQLLRVFSAIGAVRDAKPLDTSALPPNLVYPYPLQANFTGRIKEREELNAWLADGEHPIYELIAMGGMGKSALSWVWLTQDVLKSTDVKLDGVMWWSFYEGESSFAKFVDEALKYVSDKPIDAEQLPTSYDRAEELRKLLQSKRIFFVLDGVERQLRDYASLDAAYKSDDLAKPSAGARSCVDPISSRLLRDIAAGVTRAKFLLTTRLPVSDLQDRTGQALAGVRERDLRELSYEDAINFMRAQGVTKGTDGELAQACESYRYHALSLRLLSGLIQHDAKTPGDINAAPRHEVHYDLIQRQHHVLERAYDALPKRERALLSRIAAFRGPMTYEAMSIFNTLGSEKRFEQALEDLQVRGLLQRDTVRYRYDLHPIVRRYAYERANDKQAIHIRLRDYFASIPVPDEGQTQSIEDLWPLLELFHHTVRAGQPDDALILFGLRLHRLLYFSLCAYQTVIELLQALFPEDQLPLIENTHNRLWALNALATAYGSIGQPHRAARLMQDSGPSSDEEGSVRSHAVRLSNIGIIQTFLGDLVESDKNLRRSIVLSSQIGNEFDEAVGRFELATLLFHQGLLKEAEGELEYSRKVFDRLHESILPNNFVSTVRSTQSLYEMYCGNGEKALALALEARRRADDVAKNYYPIERDIIRAEWFIGIAQMMQPTSLSAAAIHLNEALTRCRRVNLLELEPGILLSLARWHWIRGEAIVVQGYAKEALTIADRCEHRIFQADIHNFLACLALEEGDRETARNEAEIARERAWCDGPPYCYKPALDESEKLLKELGVTA